MCEGSRFHNDQPKLLHLLNPLLVFFPEPRNARPLVLSPQSLCLIRVRYRLIEIDSLVVVGFPVCNVLVEPLVAYTNESDDYH